MARQLFEHLLRLNPETLRVVRALIGGGVPVELAGVRDEFRAAVGQRWSPWFRTLGFDDHSSNALVWVMTAAYLTLAMLAEDKEIGVDEAAGIVAMLADGILKHEVPLPAAATLRTPDEDVPSDLVGTIAAKSLTHRRVSKMTADSPLRTATNQRGTRYGEVFAVFSDGERFTAHVYGTQLLNDCPQELWETLDSAAIAKELGALVVKLNGPRYWVLDALGSKGKPIEPVLHEFNGLLMRRIAVLELGSNPVQVPYTLRKVDRRVAMYFDADSAVYELIDPHGLAYVMQAYCTGVDATLNEIALANLGDRLAVPDGWRFRTRILEEDLIVDTSESPATVVQDELENTYTLPF